MSAEITEVVGIAGGSISVTTVVWFLIQRAIKRGDVAEEARQVHLEKASSNHSARLTALELKCGDLDTRLKFREGYYGPDPLTNPGLRPSPELQARLNEAKEESTK